MAKLHLFKIVFVLLIVLSAVSSAEDKPSFDLNWYGYFKLDGSYDENLTSHGNFAMWVNSTQLDQNDEQFNMTANETRFGFNLTGKNYKNVTVTGKVEFDLYAGVTGGTIAENKAMLQLRHAYFSVQKGKAKLLAGQSWDLISPLNPSTLNYPVMWGAGNTGYRRPQVSLWYDAFKDKTTSITLATGFFRTIGSDLTPTFSLATGETSEGSDDGTDAGIPSWQGLLDVNHKFSTGVSFRSGVSTLWGRLKAETTLGNSEKYESWGVIGHLMVSFPADYGFSGEVFSGSNLGSYFGGILNNNTVEGVSSNGGWISGWAGISPKVKLSAGYGIDNPSDEDINTGNRSKNRCVYGNIKYSFVEQVTLGFELSNWTTDYKGMEAAETLRAQTSFILKF